MFLKLEGWACTIVAGRMECSNYAAQCLCRTIFDAAAWIVKKLSLRHVDDSNNRIRVDCLVVCNACKNVPNNSECRF